MPTLLQINTTLNSGSHGHIAEEIGKLAIADGWNSFIAYSRNERCSQSEPIKIGSDWDINWHGIETRVFDRHGLASVHATKSLIEKMKIIRPDIVQLHNIHGYYLNYPILFDFLSHSNIPVVWTLHDCWSMTGHCSHFSFIGCEKWKKICDHCPQKREYPGSLFLDRSKKNYEEKKKWFTSVKNMTIIPVSNWLSSIVEQSFLRIYPFHVIHNGIDLKVFKPRPDLIEKTKEKYKIHTNFVMLGVANRWTDRKGFSDFIKLRSYASPNSTIILIGLDSKQIKALPPGIIGIQRTEDIEEMAALYTLSDAFINPSWEDSFPTTNIESLACGTPLIVYKTGGSVEAVSNDTGYIVEQGDIEGLIKAARCIQDKGKSYFTAACRTRAESLFNQEKQYYNYIQLYNKLLSTKSYL